MDRHSTNIQRVEDRKEQVMAKWILILVLSISLIGCGKSPAEKAKELYDQGKGYSNLQCGEGAIIITRLENNGIECITTPNQFIFQVIDTQRGSWGNGIVASWSYNELTGQLFGFRKYEHNKSVDMGMDFVEKDDMPKWEMIPSIVIECERVK